MREYMDILTLAEYSSLSESTLRAMVRSGELPAVRVKRKILVRRTDFDFWARRRIREHGRCRPFIRRLADEILGRTA